MKFNEYHVWYNDGVFTNCKVEIEAYTPQEAVSVLRRVLPGCEIIGVYEVLGNLKIRCKL